jgi:hypothetical protein
MLLFLCLCPQVILGSSVDEALSWAQQEGSLAPAQAQLISAALAAKGEPFNSEHGCHPCSIGRCEQLQ